MYWACGIFTALVNHENPILLDLLEGLLGVMFLCDVSTVIRISSNKILPLRKTSDVAESSGWLVLGVAPQLGNRRTCRCTENVLKLCCLLDLSEKLGQLLRVTTGTSTTSPRKCTAGLKRLQDLLHERDLRPFRCTSGVESGTLQKDCCNHTRRGLDGWSLVLYHNREIDNLVECTGPVKLRCLLNS